MFKTRIHHQPEYLRQSTRRLRTAESTQIICRRISCGSPHSNCSCNPGFFCSCSKTVEHYSNGNQKQFIIEHFKIQTKNISFPPIKCIIVTCMLHAWDSIPVSDCRRVIKFKYYYYYIMRNNLLRMHPNEKRATEKRRSRAALLRYVVTAANRWTVSGNHWMHKKDQQQEQQPPIKLHQSMFYSE